MKSLIILLISFTLISSNQSKDINESFRNAVIEYQKAYPIPTSKHTKKRTYVYSVVFYKKDNDTLFYVVRTSTGTEREFNFLGIYSDKILKPTIISDEENLSSKMVFNKIRNKELEKFYFYDKNGPEKFPPLYRYSIKDKKLKLIKIDTLSEKWEK